MTIVASNSLTLSNVNDGTITHTAYAYSADGTDKFTTTYPNLNLLEGSKDFSGDWWLREYSENDGTYKGLTVKRSEGPGITKQFIAPKEGSYTFSAYIKSSGNNANIIRAVTLNDVTGKIVPYKSMGINFGWLRDSFQVTLKAGDKIYAQYNVAGSGVLWNAGHKWEEGSATDDLTANYPNLNLLVNSSAKTKDGFFKDFDKVENGYGEVTLKGTNDYVARGLSDGFSIQPRDYKPGDTYTMSTDIMFTSWNLPAGTTLGELWIGQRYLGGTWSRITGIDLPRDPSKMLNQWIRITQTSTIPPHDNGSFGSQSVLQTKFNGTKEASFTFRVRKPKQEPGSTATPLMPSKNELQEQLTPWMPSLSEVKTSDWPKYRGEYSDTSSEQSTNPSDYTWGPMRGDDGKDGNNGHDGIAGKDGNGIKTTVISYAISTSGTVTPTNGWTSQVPTLVKEQYLWTKTVWTYTDNTSETGYSVSYIAKDGNNGHDGIAGKDGVGIKTTTITYAGSTSGTTPPTSGWTSTVPTVEAGSYLWTKTVWAYTDNASETGYSVSKYGKTPYFHTAWSNSADGKDGFTTVYPNLNLLTDSKEFKNKSVSETTVNTSITSYDSTIVKEGNETYLHYLRTDSNYNDWFRAFLVRNGNSNFSNVDVKGNTEYTFSVWLRGTGTHTIYAYAGWTEPWNANKTITLTKEWNLYTFTVLTRSKKELNTKPFIQFFIRSDNVGSEINLKYPKVEEGSTATPYMTSKSEVKTSDYPSYIGTYSDDNIESSLDYSKYQWAIFKGQDSNAHTAYSWSSDGADRFSTVYPNLNLFEGSTKYTKDNPRIASSSATDGAFYVNDVFVKNLKAGTYTMSGKADAPWTIHATNDTNRKGKVGLWLVSSTPGLNVNISLGDTVPKTIEVPKDGDYFVRVNTYSNGTDVVTHKFWDFKLEPGSTATPWTPSQSESQEQWQDAIPMYVGVGEKDSQKPSDYRWILNPRYVQASSDSGLSSKAGLDDLASVAETANDALVQAQNAVSNEDYTSWLEHDYQSTIDNLHAVSTQNKEDINNVNDRTTIVEGFYDRMKVKWNFINESFTFSEEGMFISNEQSKMAIQVTSDKIVFWDNNVDVAFITGEVLNIQKGVFLESATIGNHLITKFSNESPVTIIRYVGGIT